MKSETEIKKQIELLKKDIERAKARWKKASIEERAEIRIDLDCMYAQLEAFEWVVKE